MLTGWLDVDRTFSLMDDFRRRMDRVLEDMEAGQPWQAARSNTWPRANLYDTGEDLRLVLQLPGVSKDSLSISSNQETLTIRGERKTEIPRGYSIHRQERSPVEFSRSFTFPVKVDADKSSAELKNGLLTITLPKLPELKPRSIEVSVG